MGTMAGTNRIIDTKAISEALQQTGLVDQIKQISLARADTENYLAFADGAVSRNIAKLIDAAKNLAIEPQITNKTGFPTPENSHWVDRINFSAAKPTTKTLIRNQFKTSGTFGSTAEMLDNLKNIKSSVDTIIESRTNATQINLSCPPTTIERFNTTLNCPAYIDAEAILNKTPIPLFVNYVSYNAGTRTPEIMLRDKAINVSTADGSLQIENITSDFIEVHDVTCYVGPSARTRSWSANHYLSIPPHTHLTDGDATLLLSETCRPIDAPLTFNRITQSMLTNRNMSFGIAIRYRKAGESTDHTLVDTKTFNALALVQRTN